MHEGILIEVLTADDDDGDLSNGTPHDEDICDGFDLHGVNSSYCGLDRGGRSPLEASADCNEDGAVDIADLACFQLRFAARARGADCNRDGRFTSADPACFQALWSAARRKESR
ncbi:MAG: hypothetical protein IT437_06190 [Phycisphaerales bacterium]|nr:hypothetical protein [Phycisphaerales bacterium]